MHPITSLQFWNPTNKERAKAETHKCDCGRRRPAAVSRCRTCDVIYNAELAAKLGATNTAVQEKSMTKTNNIDPETATFAELRNWLKINGIKLKTPTKAEVKAAVEKALAEAVSAITGAVPLPNIGKGGSGSCAGLSDLLNAPFQQPKSKKSKDWTLDEGRRSEIITAVREDKVTGNGTGSVIETKFNDTELVEMLKTAGVKAPRKARSHCRRIHETELAKAETEANTAETL